MLRHLPLADLSVSEFALGAMPWGSRITVDDALAIYDAYRAAGGNVIDTAHLYAAWLPNGLGQSELALGKVLKQRRDRGQIIVITKGGHPDMGPAYPRAERYLSPEVIRRDIAESLQRMEIDTVDLYFLHRDDRRVPVGELMDLLNEEIRAGRIRHLGASNWRPERMEEANRYAAAQHLKPLIASQPEFSLAQPNAAEAADDLGCRFMTPSDLAWHEKTRFPAFCYSPTAQGFFASGGKLKAKLYKNPVSLGRLKLAEQFAAAARGPAVTATQIALAWLRQQKFPAIPILGTADLHHLRDALAAAKVHLSAEEMEKLSASR